MAKAGCVVWLLFIAAGTLALSQYQNTPGQAASTPEQWPAKAAAQLDHQYPTLLMFAHPKCPCTRASIDELNRLLAQSGGRVAANVYFFKPENQPKDWSQTDLRRSAESIPGVQVHDDIDGSLAQRFGAETSGYIVLYSPQGRLLFKGGITGGRGHAGDNAGLASMAAILTGQTVALKQTPVYGCSILDRCENLAKVASK